MFKACALGIQTVGSFGKQTLSEYRTGWEWNPAKVLNTELVQYSDIH